jgi:hypothetical protein
MRIVIVIALLVLIGCNNRSGNLGKIANSHDTLDNHNNQELLVDTPRSFVRNYGKKDNNKLFVFVGQKIWIKPLPSRQYSFNNGFKAKYLILEKVFGNFLADTIEFVAYDHYGIPDFSKFKNVLLYVSADSGTYYQQKYMYNDVYKTQDGRWAGTYAWEDYQHAYNKQTKIKPIKIDFVEKVVYPTKMTDGEGRQFTRTYQRPYFKTVGDSAIAIYGNYIEDLFSLTRSGVLAARGLFQPTAEQEESMVESVQPEAPKTPPNADDIKFLAFWKYFVSSLKEAGLKNFRKIALDTLYVCDQLLPADKFIDNCFKHVIDDEVRKRIVDRTKLEYTTTEIEFYNLLTSQVKKEIVKVGDSYRLRKMLVTRNTKNDNPPTIYFEFIETKKGYRLYEIGHHWFTECCK